MLKNYSIGKGGSGAVKALIASSYVPAPSGAAFLSAPIFGADTVQNKLYDLASQQESKSSPDVITGMLQLFSYNVYFLLDSGSTLSYVTPYVFVCFGFDPEVISNPFPLTNMVGGLVITKRVYRVCGICW